MVFFAGCLEVVTRFTPTGGIEGGDSGLRRKDAHLALSRVLVLPLLLVHYSRSEFSAEDTTFRLLVRHVTRPKI